MAIPYTTLFTELGKIFFSGNTAEIAAKTTIFDELEDAVDGVGSASAELRSTVSNLDETAKNFRDTGVTSVLSAVRAAAVDYLVRTVFEDNPQPDNGLESSLIELFKQMIADAESVDASVPGATATKDAANGGDGVIVLSTKRGDGLINENMLGESMIATAPGPGSFGVAGEEAVGNLSVLFPKGSGGASALTVIEADAEGNNLLSNGSFDVENTTLANVPDLWEYPIATVGTTLKTTDFEVQTVILSGTPTGGSYILKYTNAGSEIQQTEPIAYNATSSVVQTELRKLVGLELIAIVESGTNPDLTHTITFKGEDWGNITQLTSTNNLTGGSTPAIAHATTTAGATYVYHGRAAEFDGNASELTTLEQNISDKVAELGQTPLGFNLWTNVDVVPAAGVVTVSLQDGSGTIINDDNGVANSFTISAPGETTAFASHTGVFRLPRIVPDVVYLRIKLTTALSSGTSMFLDHASLTPMVELYPGGPYGAAFGGNVPFAPKDFFTLAITNGEEGGFQRLFDRYYDMRGKGLLVPSVTGGGETQADSLIA